MAHRSGFVNIIGNPNVGKSTLMNALVGEKLSIITSKAQTTRHRIMGIVNGDDFQIVYSDTPGILKPAYKLQESMMNFVHGAVDDADVVLYVTDTIEQSDRSEAIIERINRSGIPTIVVINKIDLTTPEALEELVEQWQQRMPEAIIIPCSAKEQVGMKGVLDTILERLPEGEAFYPKDTLTDKTLRFFSSEMSAPSCWIWSRSALTWMLTCAMLTWATLATPSPATRRHRSSRMIIWTMSLSV